MRLTSAFAFAILALPAAGWAQPAAGGQSSGLQGTGPRVEVQQSANGTLDVGGGSDVNLQGENFRGNFGASNPQSGALSNPSARPSAGSSFPTPFGSPDFAPNLSAGSPQSGVPADAGAYRRLILPRFRASAAAGARSSSIDRSSVDGWRYRYFRGRWWYWQPGESWLYWDGARWQSFAAR
jgi:hypothetical protein